MVSDLPKKLAFIDVETTGTRWSDRVIEIGILRIEEGEVVNTFNSLINPNCYVPEEIVQMTGINPEELENSPSFYEIKKDVLEILDGCYFVAHNVRFDYSFIRNEFKRFDISFKAKQLCTVKLSRKLFPNFKHHNLDSLIERFKFDCKNRHRALDDANVLWQFWSLIQKQFTEDHLVEAVKQLLKKPSIPINLSYEILENLPESPGVYIFYGKNGMPLYVGKSINIKDRVLSHFAGDHNSSTEMKIAQQIYSVETIETAGELGALFTESNLIKKLIPLYNRQLRYSRELFALKKEQNKEGYEIVNMDSLNNIDPFNLDQVMAIFRSKKSAKTFLVNLAKEFNLCERLLGIEAATKECFSFRFGRCKGACKGSEKAPKYNLRFIKAFLKTKLRRWPFDGPILIEEKDSVSQKTEVFLVDKWCYIKSLTGGTDNTDINDYTDLAFDLDIYKILLKFISKEKNQKYIKKLNTKNPARSGDSRELTVVSL